MKYLAIAILFCAGAYFATHGVGQLTIHRASATDNTFPVFAPDGTVRLIPAEQLQDALSAGGKHAIEMSDPLGTLRYVPEDQLSAALNHGGKVYRSPMPRNTWLGATQITVGICLFLFGITFMKGGQR
jgi:hypothetical protein